MQAILEMKGIEKTFPGVRALKNIDLVLHDGEILALLGENGAGKSTLMKVLTGVHQADKGQIFAFGNEVKFKNYKDAQHLGISIIFQELSLVPYFNVWENVFFGNEILKPTGILDKKSMRQKTKEILSNLGVTIDIETPAKSLSIADQQFVEIAKALSINIKIFILDEPTSTLTPEEVKKLFSVMNILKNQGVGMVFISHHLDEIFQIADNVLVIRDGNSIALNKVADITKGELIEQMIGRNLGLNFPEKTSVDKSNASTTLSVKNLMLNSNSTPVNFHLKKGEILGLFGLIGSGRTEIVRAIIKADSVHNIEIEINNKKVHIGSPSDAYHYGIGLLPEDRKTQGLILPFSVSDNVVLNNMKKELIDFKYVKENTIDKIKQLSIKTPGTDTAVVNLSGGNQQKVIISRWLSTKCDILIFDEPTRGIDVGAKDEIYKIMHELTENGKSIIMVSSELEEILGLSHRILVIRQNKIAREIIGNTTEKEVMEYAVGGALA